MAERDVEMPRTTPTDPEAAQDLLDVAEGAETFAEPSGTLAEARRTGADVSPEASDLDDALTRQRKLDEAREAMQATPIGDAAEDLGQQEEETARIADSLAFPGTGIREMRERADVEGSMEDLRPAPEIPAAADVSDAYPPAEWPPKDDRTEE